VLDRLQRFVLTGPDWGDVPVMRPLPSPDGDPWGVLAPLKGTPFEGLIPVVSGEAWSHALNGHLTPLMREIGPAPSGLLKMVPDGLRLCSWRKGCGSFVEMDCRPGPTVPDCWTVPGVKSGDIPAFVETVLAWRDGKHVVVVSGEEFV